MGKEELDYPELTLSNKKVIVHEEKAKLFQQFLKSIFVAEPEHKITDQEKKLTEMNILNNKDLKIKDISESHKNIDKEELENIIKK